MRSIAQDMRELMAQLGFRTVDEMVGRVDRLEPRKAIDHWKARGFDFSNILYQPDVGEEVGRYCSSTQEHGLENSLDVTTLLALCAPAIERGEAGVAELPIRNTNRVVGTITGSEVTRRHGARGLPADTIRLKFNGSAGQSFGAFLPPGMTLHLEGAANDYVGKGLSGGKLIIHPPAGSSFVAADNIIVGNVALYGGTRREAFLPGPAGRRPPGGKHGAAAPGGGRGGARLGGKARRAARG